MLKPKFISIVSVFASCVLLMVASPPLLAQTDRDDRGVVGDVDGDGDVDLSDLGILLAAWLSEPGDPNWYPGADLDGDGDVDQSDLGILMGDWG